MEEPNIRQINGQIDGLFIEKDVTLYSEDNFLGYGFDNLGDIEEELFGIIRNKYSNLNIFNTVLEQDRVLTAIVFFQDADISTLGFNLHVSAGSVLASTKKIDLDNLSKVQNLAFNFGYGTKHTTKIGTGPKEYEISAMIRDDYKLRVFANSEEEALSLADTIPINEWEHPDVAEDAHLEDRRVIRHCRWGNLSVKEL